MTDKLGALTGLRFIAAAMILIHHAVLLGIPIPNYALDHGVSFFFVLSGFILAYKYPALATGEDIRRFYVARIARIWPAHACALVFVVTLLGQSIWHWPFAATLFLVQGWIPSLPWYAGFNGPSWSVSTEMFFYLVFPLLILGWARSWWWKWLLSAALVAAMIALGTWRHLPDISQADEPTLHGLLYISPLARLFEFVTGMVACSAFRLLQPVAKQLSRMAFTALEIAVTGLAAYSVATNMAALSLARYVTPVGWAWLCHAADVVVFPFVLVVFALGRGLLSRVLASPPLIVLGEMSYATYLLHSGVFVYWRLHLSPDTAAADYSGYAACVAITLAVSAACWLLIERPSRAALLSALGPSPRLLPQAF